MPHPHFCHMSTIQFKKSKRKHMLLLTPTRQPPCPPNGALIELHPCLRSGLRGSTWNPYPPPPSSPPLYPPNPPPYLAGNSRSIRHVMAQQMKQMKRVPQLRFDHVDVSKAVDVMVTLERLSAERKAKQGAQSEGDEIDFDLSDEEAFADDDGFWEEEGEEGEAEAAMEEEEDESAWDLLEETAEEWADPQDSKILLERQGALIRVFR